MKHEKSKNDAMRHELDHIDAKILNLLRENARMPLKEIAEHVFLSSPAVSARIERLEKEGIRTELDLRNEKIGFKVREAQMMKIPYMLVLGDKEVEQNVVNVRTRKGETIGNMSIDDLVAKLKHEIETKAVD